MEPVTSGGHVFVNKLQLLNPLHPLNASAHLQASRDLLRDGQHIAFQGF